MASDPSEYIYSEPFVLKYSNQNTVLIWVIVIISYINTQ